jgi:DNA-binding CsgD family transcriptional regulator
MTHMKESFVYPEQVHNVVERREGHGIILLTDSLELLFIDSRASKLCQEIRRTSEHHDPVALPIALVKVCGEIIDLLPLRNHPKDWEEFSVKRVIRGVEGQIFVCGIALPAMAPVEPGILLTLDHIGSRSRPRLQTATEQFNLTPREIMVVEKLLQGSTNKEIGNELQITEQTAKEHLKHIMQKTHTTTRTAILSALSGVG